MLRLQSARWMPLAVTALLAGCGGDAPSDITYNGGPTTLPSVTLEPPAPPPIEATPPVLAERIDRGVDRAGDAVDATLDRVDASVTRATDRADRAIQKADTTVDHAVQRVDATVERAEQQADRAVGQAVNRARVATGRAAEGVRRVGDALDSFSRGLERTPPATR